MDIPCSTVSGKISVHLQCMRCTTTFTFLAPVRCYHRSPFRSRLAAIVDWRHCAPGSSGRQNQPCVSPPRSWTCAPWSDSFLDGFLHPSDWFTVQHAGLHNTTHSASVLKWIWTQSAQRFSFFSVSTVHCDVFRPLYVDTFRQCLSRIMNRIYTRRNSCSYVYKQTMGSPNFQIWY
jgi:hypothetical protein